MGLGEPQELGSAWVMPKTVDASRTTSLEFHIEPLTVNENSEERCLVFLNTCLTPLPQKRLFLFLHI